MWNLNVSLLLLVLGLVYALGSAVGELVAADCAELLFEFVGDVAVIAVVLLLALRSRSGSKSWIKGLGLGCTRDALLLVGWDAMG